MLRGSLVSLLLLVASGATVAACDDDDEGASSGTRTPSTTTAPGDQKWKEVVPGGDCECADGSKFAFWERPARAGERDAAAPGRGCPS
jgi:hypothetical protein